MLKEMRGEWAARSLRWPAISNLGTRLDHGADVRGAGRIGKHRSLQVGGRQAVPDREPEEVYHLVRVRPDAVGARDAPRVLLDERLEAIDAFSQAPGGMPLRNLF